MGYGLCATDRNDIDSIDGGRLLLQTRLDPAHERFDLLGAEVVVDVDARDDPHLIWADECDDQFADRGHAAVRQEKSSDSLDVGRLEWLADEEVVAAPGEPKACTNQQQSDQHTPTIRDGCAGSAAAISTISPPSRPLTQSHCVRAATAPAQNR